MDLLVDQDMFLAYLKTLCTCKSTVILEFDSVTHPYLIALVVLMAIIYTMTFGLLIFNNDSGDKWLLLDIFLFLVKDVLLPW